MPWQTDHAAPAPVPLSIGTTLRRGLRGRCPRCGEGRLFRGYLRVVEECAACHVPLGHIRADDAPPYFTIFIVGHVLLPPALMVEKMWQPPMWLHMTVWLPLFAGLCLLVLRPVKGAVLAWMQRLGLSGTEQGPDILPPRQGPGDA